MSDNEEKMRAQRLVWVDLEMTGLDISKDCIIEMACIITDGDLNIIEKGPDFAIKRSDEILDNMNPWCIDHHGKTGLTKKCRESTITIEEAEKQMVEFLKKHVDKGKCPLAGNTVHEDKKFLIKEMPLVVEMLHYRIVDVSSVKEMAKRWYPELPSPPKRGTHRALEDIEDSIDELKYYRKHIFVNKLNN
eukprot:gene2316-2855_t